MKNGGKGARGRRDINIIILLVYPKTGVEDVVSSCCSTLQLNVTLSPNVLVCFCDVVVSLTSTFPLVRLTLRMLVWCCSFLGIHCSSCSANFSVLYLRMVVRCSRFLNIHFFFSPNFSVLYLRMLVWCHRFLDINFFSCSSNFWVLYLRTLSQLWFM